MTLSNSEELGNILNANREQLKKEVEKQEEPAEQQEQAIEVEVEIENPIEGDSPSPSIPERNGESTSDELETESPMGNESQGGEEEQQDPVLEQGEYGQSEEQEKISSNQPVEEFHEEKTILPEKKTDLSIIGEALERNEESLKELEEYLASAEKRFFKFMEKAVSPVLDGLYSGKKFASDLIEELTKSGNDQLQQTKQWLTVYDKLMSQIEQFFEKFSIKLYIPSVGSLFDENTQEPIGVVEDEQFQDEQIKEVVRYGLIYEKEIDHQSSFLFRPAQVIVVKNKMQQDLESGEGNEDESR